MLLHMAILLGDSIYGMELVLALYYITRGFASWDGLLSKSTEKRCTGVRFSTVHRRCRFGASLRPVSRHA